MADPIAVPNAAIVVPVIAMRGEARVLKTEIIEAAPPYNGTATALLHGKNAAPPGNKPAMQTETIRAAGQRPAAPTGKPAGKQRSVVNAAPMPAAPMPVAIVTRTAG